MAQSNLTMFGWIFIMNFIMKENVRFKFKGSQFANGGVLGHIFNIQSDIKFHMLS